MERSKGMTSKNLRDRLFLAQTILLVSAGACSSPPDSLSSNEIFDSAGVRVIHNARPLWKEGEAWTVSQEAFLSIGTFSGREEYQFVEVSSGTRTVGGEVVVADRGARTVRVYDRSGVFVRTLGGPGAGPGEFQDPAQVVVSQGDSVLVWDDQALRVTRFDSSGQLAGVETLDLAGLSKAATPPLYPGRIELLETGDYLIRLVEKAVKKNPPGLSEPYRDRSGALWVSMDYSVVDTLAFFMGVEQVAVEAPFGRYPVPLPLGRDTWIASGSHPPRVCIGEQVGEQGGEGIKCFSREGIRTEIRWVSSLPPVSEEEMEEWREENIRFFGPKLSDREILAMLDQVPSPQARPPHSQLLLDVGGNLWARLGPTEGGGGASIDYLVFDPEGKLLGAVALPPIEVLEIGEGYVLGVYRDELEVEFVQLYDLTKVPIPMEER
jgi:hypothetical protein